MKLQDLPSALNELREAHLLREPDDDLQRQSLQSTFADHFIDAASNDYLGLGGNEYSIVSRETSWLASGAGASRLVHGSRAEHLQVEDLVACWLAYDAGLLFSSGYAANLGALAALVSPGDAVFSDSLNHASLIDGLRLAKSRPTVYRHLDLAELELGLRAAGGASARWVITESYYSMDGDGPDLARMRSLCDHYDAALYVDEAHSVGSFGPKGAGLCALAGVQADVLVAAFGKAVGSEGACILGSHSLRTWLWNRARSFVFSTAPSPLRTEVLLRQIQLAQAADRQREDLHQSCKDVRARLEEAGVALVPGSFGPIVSLVVGSESSATSLAGRLRQEGILAQAIRPPTVAVGESRVRLVLRSGLSSQQKERLVLCVSRETSTRAKHE